MINRQLPPFDKNWAFFFDIDGTIADIAATPEDAHIPPATLEDLLSLQKKSPIALVSGRSLVSINSMTSPAMFPAAGQHGLEIRFSSSEILHVAGNGSPINSLVEKVKLFQVEHPGIIVEYKGLSIAIHYRMRPDLSEMVSQFLEFLLEGKESTMCLQYGKMVGEIKLRGGNKGTAIETFMRRSAFQNKTPVFAGDDVTDEDAHRVVNRLGGISIQVGSSSDIAQYTLKTPDALRAWLHKIVTLEMAEV